MAMLPQAFISQLQQLLPDDWVRLSDAITGSAPVVSVRVNAHRHADVPVDAQRVPWCHTGFYCLERPAFTFDPDLHGGRYYVQDASSMFIGHVLRTLAVGEPLCYLDLCAAPGGKTTAALDALPSGSLVVANELVPARARVLRDNVVRWGNPGAVVTNATPRALGRCKACFDIIAADVPCSGEGMMRKDAEAVEQWSPALVRECAERQRAIIADVWPALKPGGLLIYSTCTYNREENEQIVEHLIACNGAEPVAVPIHDAWNILPAIGSEVPCYRFMPHCTRGEGLFMAVLRKPGEAAADKPRTPKQRSQGKAAKAAAIPPQLRNWLLNPDTFAISMQGDAAVALPLQWHHMVQQLSEATTVLHSGVTVATLKGGKPVPDHSLAMSTALRREAFAACEVDYPTALQFLRGEALTIDAPKGYTLITYHDTPLGWVNNLGNRANNLYPKPLRILSTHAPTTPPKVL